MTADLFSSEAPTDPLRGSERACDAWVKTTRGASPIPTLLPIAGDGNDYRAARFELAGGCRIGTWPGSGLPCVELDNERMPLYEACQRRLAWEI